ncbi:LLM class F420-dependent oxidoreductase [Nocardioides sp. JQ2195]|uniref:LLM class F420-dependent oxidoreductase n=1 Tax=Nocardioides sp. JQ2195 TaxID=2592334 RepID=UPI00143E5F44|nr:LLM class F420-dependent oxidoreductase [Nocardioides sp. JQ2195]QIX27577.1 LLM class F420-dependent oxidoreductase [Nocardioides sp. JQ2195]
MTKYGYFLSCEEYGPAELVEQAVHAEAAGFDSLWISDHFHPWNDEQGESPFVWSVIGALSQACSLPVTTAVTCPTVRISPVVIAQAAATSAVMLEGRFTLGLGSGEALNEHILGDGWPTAEVRQEMLAEAIDLIRELWDGGFVNHRGRYYTADTARIYTLPDEPPPIFVSGFGPEATDLAARKGDGYITTSPDTDLLQRFRKGSGGKPAQAGTKVSWAETEQEGVEIAHRLWGTSGLPGELAQVLPSPRHFEQAAQLVTPEQTRDSVVCGSDPERHREALRPFVEAGFEEVYVANMGPHWRQMIDMYAESVLPVLRA